MLHYAALDRRERQQRLARIADIGAAQHGGDHAKKLIAALKS